VILPSKHEREIAMNRTSTILLLLLPLLLGACASGTKLFTPATLNREKDLEHDSNKPIRDIEFFGPDTMITRERIEPINLLFMLDPKGRARSLYADSRQDNREKWSELTIDEKYEWGFHAFYDSQNQAIGSTIEQRRNRLQDRMLITSDQRCGIYKRVLYQVQADSKFWTGTLATITGVVGSLFTGRGAQNLSATSGILSGAGAEFSQAYYANLAANVITKGIEERRKAIHARIATAQKATISQYTVQAAVKDAVFYDMQCSIVAGLEEAQDAIRLAADPGMDAANRIIAKQKITSELVKADIGQVKKLSEDFAALQSASLLGGDRFSNIGVATLTTTRNAPQVEPEFFSSLAFNPDTETDALRIRMQEIFAKVAAKESGGLELEDTSATPPKPAGALQEFDGLTTAFTDKVATCSNKLMGEYGTKLGEASKETKLVDRDEKFIQVRAVYQRIELVQRALLLQRSRIEGLRADYLAQLPAALFDGALDGSDKGTNGIPKPVKLRSLKDVDAQNGKKHFEPAVAEIRARIGELCN